MDVYQAVYRLKNVFPKSRLLFACHNCFNRTPPIIVELGDLDTCSWCSTQRNEVLLHETVEKIAEHDRKVEYTVIRQCNKVADREIKDCKHYSRLKWKSCSFQDTCFYAHSKIEKEIWLLESKFHVDRKDLVKEFQLPRPQNQNLLNGVFHCVVCSLNVDNGRQFSEHCDSSSHRSLMRNPEHKWMYRPLPETENLVLCESHQQNQCDDEDYCLKAHSKEELREWQLRSERRRDLLKYANEAGQLPFKDKIIEEYRQASSPATVLKDFLPGIRVQIDKENRQRISRGKTISWLFNVHCNNHSQPSRSSQRSDSKSTFGQGCGSGYFSTASASASTPSASASTNKKRENDR